MKSFSLLGVPISAVDLNSAVSSVEDWCTDRQGRYVCVRDVHGVVLATRSSDFLNIHKNAAMVAPDGKPISFIGRALGHNIEQTTGSDLIDAVLRSGCKNGTKHFFYGGKAGVADHLSDFFKQRYPGVDIVGCMSPPFRELTDQERQNVVARIVESGADIVWVGLSTPKQERWMYDNYRELPCTLIGVGAAFDFHTGKIKRAPVFMQRMMLEWLYRAFTEPRRLGRRYMQVVPQFIYLVLLERLRLFARELLYK